MDVAESMIRIGGFHAFSFRDIAKEVGLKSASVHYHFPTKEDLGAAVMKRYAGRCLEALGSIDDFAEGDWEGFVRRFIGIVYTALCNDRKLCLCGMLAAESLKLPTAVVVEVVASVEGHLERLEEALLKGNWTTDPGLARRAATYVFSSLEGAMMLSVLTSKDEHVEQVSEMVIESLRALHEKQTQGQA